MRARRWKQTRYTTSPATNMATALVAGGVVDAAVAGGVEVMSRVPIGASGKKDLGLHIAVKYRG